MAEFQDQFNKIADSESFRVVLSRLALIVRVTVRSWKENLQLTIHKGQSQNAGIRPTKVHYMLTLSAMY